jgi:hypothetical protein
MSNKNRIPRSAWEALARSYHQTEPNPCQASVSADEIAAPSLPTWLTTAFGSIADDRESLHERLDELVTALRDANVSGQLDGVRQAGEEVYLIGRITLDLLQLAEDKSLQKKLRVLHLDTRNEQPVYHQCQQQVHRLFPLGGDLFEVAVADGNSGFWLRPLHDVGTGLLCAVHAEGQRSYFFVTVTGEPAVGQE